MDKSKGNYKNFKMSELGENLARLTRIAQNEGIPLLIIIDGWESCGKGDLINNIVSKLNPKYYAVEVFDRPSQEETKYPFLKRFWVKIPKKGYTKIFDRSFYYEVMGDLDLKGQALDKKIREISTIEKALYDDYTVIVKFFMDISKDSQKERIDLLYEAEGRSFYVDNMDREQNQNYQAYRDHIGEVLSYSDFSYSPWHILDAENLKEASKEALGKISEELIMGIERMTRKRESGVRIKRAYQAEEKPLNNLDMDRSLAKNEYKSLKDELQYRAADLLFKYYDREIPTILVFEGVDAAGKDGAISRLVKRMDPRLYRVNSIFASDETELSYNYLWRFYTKIPQDGRMAIFSRSWYGRVMVERIENIATDNEWERAYSELLEFEKHFYDHGGLIIKFFIAIDKDEQLLRFKARENDIDKQYKITEEDWRNREKWDQYIEAINEMLDRTQAPYAPWVIVEGNDKRYARIKVLKTYIEEAEKRLKQLS